MIEFCKAYVGRDRVFLDVGFFSQFGNERRVPRRTLFGLIFFGGITFLRLVIVAFQSYLGVLLY